MSFVVLENTCTSILFMYLYQFHSDRESLLNNARLMLLSHSGEHGVAAMCDIIQGHKKSVPLHIA